MIKRLVLLLALFICAFTWACLMGVDFLNLLRGAQAVPVVGGYTAKVAYIDKASFPKITAYVSVVDDNGQTVKSLSQGDFSLTEDGRQRDIVNFVGSGEQPVTAVMLIDHSGSMEEETKMEDAIAAALVFLERLQNGRDRLGVIAFDDKVTVLGSLAMMDDTVRSSLSNKIRILEPAGGTAYFDTIYRAVDMLRNVSGRKVVLALTDGMDNVSSRSLGTVVRHARENDVVVFTIGLGTQLDRGTLQQIAQNTGGEYYERPSGGDLAQLYAEIAQGLQEEYSLTYDSATPKLDGTTRQLEVVVQGPAGTAVAVGTYAVGGTLTPSLSLWPCLCVFPLLVLLALPPLYDLVRGRGRLAEPEPELAAPPKMPSTPRRAPSPAAPAPPQAVGVCPACGEALRAGARFCPACGASPAEAQRAPVCAHCGAALRPGAGFCRACGQPVASRAQVASCSRCGARLKPGARFCAKCGQGV